MDGFAVGGLPERPTKPMVGYLHLRTVADLLGVPVAAFSEPPEARLLHTNANGDRWLLTLGTEGYPVVRHLANAASGWCVTDMAIASFLARDVASPQNGALLSLINAALTIHLGL